MPPRGDPLVGHRMSLPPEPETVRRRTVWRRVWGLCAALLGVAMLLLGAAGLAIVPSLIEDEKAFGIALVGALPGHHHPGGSSWTCIPGGVMITRVSGMGPTPVQRRVLKSFDLL